MENIIQCIKKHYPVSDSSIQLLTSYFTLCEFPKKYSLVQEGAYCKVAYFIEKGITRSFWLVDGKEITTSFSCEGDTIFSMDEFYYGKPSQEFIEALEDVSLYSIPLEKLNFLYHTNIEIANWGRVIHQNGYRQLHNVHKERLTLPAKERYKQMQERFPAICSRVNLGYIASYLGVTLPTLSKIRAND